MALAQRFLAVLAALMGASGVALAAAGAHVDGGEFARTASLFLILHAAALIAVCAHRAGPWPTVSGFALAAGAILFSADLSTRAFLGARLFPYAAPIGGSLMILAWLALALAFGLVRRASAP
ncbi:MAG: DUF423 domain-containing protein [Roseiarcus sp.]|jgi:uncharacterized membrane protein YgdD (TMEM256/DUF423 family)